MLELNAAPESITRQVLRHPLVRDVVIVLAWFAALGVLCAVIWWQVTPLAEFTRTSDNAQMGEDQLGRQVSSDGWYFTIAAAAGLLSGIVLLAARRRDPIAMVVLVAAGSVLASWVMVRVGLWLGPADPGKALAHVPVGGKVPMQLQTHADGVRFAWPVAALVGALGVLWGLDESRHTPAHATLPEDGLGTPTSG
ncbi:MAG TPA: hypothetical protein VFE07_00965 [Marmoricola sp.]|jgi:hypothetical protein|nr:hypothetical protein [Marmoricola sp.]